MLKIDAIDTFYGTSQALFGMSLDVDEGEVVTLLGRNGMGKTTTIHSLMGLTPPRSGTIRFGGRRVERLPSYRIARLGVGLVPEGRQIFPNLSARENLLATAARSDDGKDAPAWTVDQVLEMFPALADRLDQMGTLLSGGEQQMLAIGRALLTRPRLLVLDEATEGLAPLVRREIWACLERLKQQGQSILIVDKNIDDLQRLADRHYIIEKGRSVWNGDGAALRAAPDLLERYLGV